MYGCLAGPGSEGEEGEDKGEEARGALPPTASLLSLRVRHCSLSHPSPTCSHTYCKNALRGQPQSQSHTEQPSVSPERGLGFASYVFGPSCLLPFFSPLSSGSPL